MKRRAGLAKAWVFVALAAMASVVGCSGQRMVVDFANADFREISMQTDDDRVVRSDADIVRLDCSRCVWWLDDKEQVNIAGWFHEKSLINSAMDRSVYLTFVAGPPSHGVGRNYVIGLSSVRLWIDGGVVDYRARSIAGIMGVEDKRDDVLVGSFKLTMSLTATKLLGGWGRPGTYHVVGTFRAEKDIYNEGPAVRQLTEGDGFERHRGPAWRQIPGVLSAPKPASRTTNVPTTKPASSAVKK